MKTSNLKAQRMQSYSKGWFGIGGVLFNNNYYIIAHETGEQTQLSRDRRVTYSVNLTPRI